MFVYGRRLINSLQFVLRPCLEGVYPYPTAVIPHDRTSRTRANHDVKRKGRIFSVTHTPSTGSSGSSSPSLSDSSLNLYSEQVPSRMSTEFHAEAT